MRQVVGCDFLNPKIVKIITSLACKGESTNMRLRIVNLKNVAYRRIHKLNVAVDLYKN